MALSDCSEKDQQTIADSLRASVEGPFFPDWEFSSLFGLERSEVAVILRAWPDVDPADERVRLAVSNALGNLLGYPHGHEDNWYTYFSVPPSRLIEVLQRWKQRPDAGTTLH